MNCKTPCCYFHHPKFLKELDDFTKKHGSNNSDEAIVNIERLLTKHFYSQIISFTPKHLGMAQDFSGFTVYWTHLIIPNSGISRTQQPKSYFLKIDNHICFLCLDSHIQNYKDSKLRKIAKNRIKEIIEVLKTHTS